ncbi:response regulator transcription factor [Rhizobium sp. BK176]|uniref:response regulator transcription factor n=1 Tax=Rhizobium sp. BK176 TaxID=2587071 RepID=UPI002A3867D1|nr:FixJ family two-component response regulator [Rhizobium sp. BK176]
MSGSRAKIVAIVDDDRKFRVALEDMLASAGIYGELYASGEDFMSSKGYLTCDCILSDLRMPGMSGIELLRRLREGGIEQPVILMTSYPDPDAASVAFELGACAFLSKPLDSSELLNLLRPP